MEVDLTLSFSENQWVCFDETFEIKGYSLDELDANLTSHFKSKFKKGTINVTMFFDFDHFPTWHRQYMSHYFNRSLTFNLNS